MTDHDPAPQNAPAAALRLQGTPSFFVHGKASAGSDPAESGRMIEAAKR